MELHIQLIKTLPPLVAIIVWDVINNRITQTTIELAQATTKEEFDQYDIVRCIAASNPDYPPKELAMGLVEEMLEAMATVQ